MKRVNFKVEKMYELLSLIKTPKFKLKKVGAIRTPVKIVDEMINQVPEEVWKKGGNFLDPCCGRGTFLLRVIDKLLNYHTKEEIKHMIYGIDIDPYMIHCTQILIGKKLNINPTELLNIQEANIIHWKPKNNMKFNLSPGNPPYKGDLHLKIFNKIFDFMKDGGYVIFIQPATPYFNKNFAKTISNEILNMQKTISENITKVTIKPAGIFEGVRFQSDFAISLIQRKNSTTKNIDSITYKDGRTYEDIPLKYITMTNIPPDMIESIYKKYEQYIIKYGSLDDYVSKNISELKAPLPKIRGTLPSSKDYYTFIPLAGKDRIVYETLNYSDFGVLLSSTETIGNFHNYLESTIARFGLIFFKCSQNTTAHEFIMIPKVNFDQQYTDDYLQQMLNLTAAEIEIMTTTLAGKYSRKI